MREGFKKTLADLNHAQRAAVEQIDGPMLVLAGPGTGKTQLLSVRVANILNSADVSPSNILCLTFTDNAARNMRERLGEIIGQPAFHVAIHTFHSFGVEIINHYPDYFTNRQLLQQLDELGSYQLMQEIFDELPHSNPLSIKVGGQYIFIKDSLEAIGWLKQNAIAPAELHKLINANQSFIDKAAKLLAGTFTESPSAKHLLKYRKLQTGLAKLASRSILGFVDLASLCSDELLVAIQAVDAKSRWAPTITKWRSRWCQKDATGRYVFKDGGQNMRKLHALANLYQTFQERMSQQGLYDFNDMVMEALAAVESSSELRFNLQERYQYILVDEFQDTNKAQLRMLYALGDNPVHESRPNIMVVGDDDQAIYAFQGAEASNLAAFVKKYNVEPIVLKENYRSHESILKAADAITRQIDDRLQALVPSAKKHLVAKKQWPKHRLEHLSFMSELAQYDSIAEQIASLISSGVPPEEIAVVAPRHRYLERLVPYLGKRAIPVAYERRENILEAPIVLQILKMSELVVAISQNCQDEIDALLPEVLAYEFFGVESTKLVELSMKAYKSHKHWLEVLQTSSDKQARAIAEWFVQLARRSRLEPMEYVLDQLIGEEQSALDNIYDEAAPATPRPKRFISPLKDYYFNEERWQAATDSYLTLLGQLSSLRQNLRAWQPNRTLFLSDLAEFCQLHQLAGLKIIDTNPHTQATRAVQVMTAFKAKGLEFGVVFVINAQDEIWGPTARTQPSRISLPPNLPIKPAGEEIGDRLRLLFVALTRAKHSLTVTSYRTDLENRPSPSLSFIEDINSLKAKQVNKPAPAEAEKILLTDWSYRFRQIIADQPTLMEPILADYKLSVTHLNNFLDVKDGGPRYFLVHNLLRFPESISPSAAYGDAMHATIKWLYGELKTTGKLPNTTKLQNYFSDMLGRKHLKNTDRTKLDQRGREAIVRFAKEQSSLLKPQSIVERGFNNDGVVVGGAHLSGKIDLIDTASAGWATVFDFKTGKPCASWQGKDEFEKIKLHKYRQQLLFYKLLVENSASFAGRLKVAHGELNFIEPDTSGKLVQPLNLEYDASELERFIKLISAVWQHISQLNFPDTEKYPKNLRGISSFEEDLIDGEV